MKILHVIRGLANSSGTTHIVNPLALAQAQLGASVRIVHVEKFNAASVVPDSSLVQSRCFALSLPFDNPGVSWSFARSISSELAVCDVVHVHAVWNFPTWMAMLCSRMLQKPYIVAPQGSFDPWALRQNAWGKRIYGALTELPLLRGATCLQALTIKEAAQFRRVGLNAPAVVIPNGVSSDFTQTVRTPGALARKLGLPSGTRTVLFLSRIHKKKGLDLLIDAFAVLCREFSKIHLVVAGHDSGSGYSNELKSRIGGLGLTSRCTFIGEVSGQLKIEVLSGADAFCLISRSEGLPVAVIEALGCGVPSVISTECNIPEVEECQAGWVVEPTVEGAASALRELFSCDEDASGRGARGRALVESVFTWERIAASTLRTYQAMLQGRPC